MRVLLSRENLLRLLLALAAFAALLFFFTPPWGAFRLWWRVPEMSGLLEVRRGVSVLQQVAHPGEIVADPLHRVIQWRLLFPILGRLLHLSPIALFALAPLGCLLVLLRLVALCRSLVPQPGWPATSAVVLCLGAASWQFTSTHWLGYYDAWLALALLAVAFDRSLIVVTIACLAGPWIDERFILALPGALLCRHLWSISPPAGPTPVPWRQWGVPIGLAGAYIIIRLGLLHSQSGHEATLAGYFGSQDYSKTEPGRLVLGMWEGLRCGWFFVAVAVYLMFASPPGGKASPRSGLVLAAVVLAMIAGGLATAQDYSRSMTMLLPVAVLGALLTLRDSRVLPWRTALPTLAVAALLLPAHHVMSDRVNRVFYLYHELAALDSPPAAAMPELYELRAIHAMERGDYDRARADLTLAIRLAPNPASAAKERGILSAGQGHWAEALQDFSLMVEHDADNPDAWLMRAQAHLALGDAPAARADFEHARSLAPAAWLQRGDVARFAAKLNPSR